MATVRVINQLNLSYINYRFYSLNIVIVLSSYSLDFVFNIFNNYLLIKL